MPSPRLDRLGRLQGGTSPERRQRNREALTQQSRGTVGRRVHKASSDRRLAAASGGSVTRDEQRGDRRISSQRPPCACQPVTPMLVAHATCHANQPEWNESAFNLFYSRRQWLTPQR
jgi:hypothetical protein